MLFIYDCAAKNLVFTPDITEAATKSQSPDVIRPFDGNALLTLLHPQDTEILRDMLKIRISLGKIRPKRNAADSLNRKGITGGCAARGSCCRIRRQAAFRGWEAFGCA